MMLFIGGISFKYASIIFVQFAAFLRQATYIANKQRLLAIASS
jgi:hypothetical protein